MPTLATEPTEDPNIIQSVVGLTLLGTPKHITPELPRACYTIDGLHNGVSQPLRLNGHPGGNIAIPYY